MLHRIISAAGDGDFCTIQSALEALPGQSLCLEIRPGVYREKLFSERPQLILRGLGTDPGDVVLRWQDGAKQPHPDGNRVGTFRSYTLFVGGQRAALQNLTVENAAGDGRAVGQAVALYADARQLLCEDVRLLARQDTLFCAPLPEAEREPGGFRGPRELAPRLPSEQYYKNCFIEGDIDFIFGGADAVFEGCTLSSRSRGEAVNGYVTAPSGAADGLGFVFLGCQFISPDAAPGSVYLGRPWRPEGKTALLGCQLGTHIQPAGWCAWPGRTDEEASTFVEQGSTGPAATPATRAPWSHQLSETQASALRAQAESLAQRVQAACTK